MSEPAQPPPSLRDRYRGRTPLGRLRMLIWLVFIAIPLINAITSDTTGAAKALTIVAAVAFVAVFIAVATVDRKPLPDPLAFAAMAFLLGVATALTVLDRESWATLFVYTVAVGAMCLRPPLAFQGVLLCTAVCIAASLVGGSSFGTAISFAISTAGIGMLMLVMADLRTRNAELHEARAELARLAVAEERIRFARDLHDLLGHSLSLIALKAELAGRLLPHQGREAAVHVSEIEDVARGALTEVREAVSGYRRMTLDDELEGARVALSAAGIEAEVLRPAVTLDPAVEAVLAWTVREGATNVIRHSHADRCSLKVTAGLGEAGVEVVDDGRGADPGLAGVNGDSGHGIEGLRERVQGLHGRIEAGARPEGGFRLAVNVPVPAR
jgi:two-component system, NarL family, sensor histidine kinase DesK